MRGVRRRLTSLSQIRTENRSQYPSKGAESCARYPKDFTSGCTQEARHYRDAYMDFTEAGAVIVGVSTDSQVAYTKYSNTYLLTFSLLSDKGARLRPTA